MEIDVKKIRAEKNTGKKNIQNVKSKKTHSHKSDNNINDDKKNTISSQYGSEKNVKKCQRTQKAILLWEAIMKCHKLLRISFVNSYTIRNVAIF